MRTTKITSTADLIKVLNELPNNYAFRGHSDSDWILEASLERMLGEEHYAERAVIFENRALSYFMSKFSIYNRTESEPMSKLSWLALMQHHGVPTRLLDFTESPYVALYFALEAYRPNDRKDMAVFAVDYSSLMDTSISMIRSIDNTFNETRESIQKASDKVFDQIVDGNSHNVLWITEPAKLNVRIDRQTGTFLISGNVQRRIGELIESDSYKLCNIDKYVISYNLYPSIYALLRKMNITAKSLYGDLNGLAQAIKMELQVYSI
jgi:hypothetical protein